MVSGVAGSASVLPVDAVESLLDIVVRPVVARSTSPTGLSYRTGAVTGTRDSRGTQ